MTSGYGETSQEWDEAPAPETPVTKRTANAAERINEDTESLRGRVCYAWLTETLRDRERVRFYAGQVNDLTRAIDVDPDEVTVRVEVQDYAGGDLARVRANVFGKANVKGVRLGVVMNFHRSTKRTAVYMPIAGPE